MVVSVFGGRSNVFEWMTATDPEEAKRWLGPPASSGDSFGLSLAAHVINQVGDVDLLRSVVRAGCDVNAAALKGSHPQINMIYTLSDLACWLTRPSPFFEFWSYSCRCSPLHCAVYNANLTAVEALLELKADVNSRVHVHKMTPLHLAAQGGHTLIAQRLLDSGADPCARDIASAIPANGPRCVATTRWRNCCTAPPWAARYLHCQRPIPLCWWPVS